MTQRLQIIAFFVAWHAVETGSARADAPGALKLELQRERDSRVEKIDSGQLSGGEARIARNAVGAGAASAFDDLAPDASGDLAKTLHETGNRFQP